MVKVIIGQRKRLIPAGEYFAVVEEIRPFKYGGKRDSISFEFRIVEGEYNGAKVSGFINANYESFSEYSKLYQWIVRATGYTPDPGESIDLDDFKLRVLRVKVETKIARRTENEFSNVTDILGLVREL